MDGDGLTLEILYRLVYGRCRDRLGKFYCEQSPEAIRADPLAGLGTFDPVMNDDPEFNGTVSEAVEDALAGRKPRWKRAEAGEHVADVDAARKLNLAV